MHSLKRLIDKELAIVCYKPDGQYAVISCVEDTPVEVEKATMMINRLNGGCAMEIALILQLAEDLIDEARQEYKNGR